MFQTRFILSNTPVQIQYCIFKLLCHFGMWSNLKIREIACAGIWIKKQVAGGSRQFRQHLWDSQCFRLETFISPEWLEGRWLVCRRWRKGVRQELKSSGGSSWIQVRDWLSDGVKWLREVEKVTNWEAIDGSAKVLPVIGCDGKGRWNIESNMAVWADGNIGRRDAVGGVWVIDRWSGCERGKKLHDWDFEDFCERRMCVCERGPV